MGVSVALALGLVGKAEEAPSFGVAAPCAGEMPHGKAEFSRLGRCTSPGCGLRRHCGLQGGWSGKVLGSREDSSQLFVDQHNLETWKGG